MTRARASTPWTPEPGASSRSYHVSDAAKLALAHGLVPLPVRNDGSKAPDVPEWPTRSPGHDELNDWFEPSRNVEGVGLLTGTISGHLEVLEFDDIPTIQRFGEAADEAGLGDIVTRLDRGYCERTPGGGQHWLFTTEHARANTKLARRPCPDPANCVKHEAEFAVHGEAHRYVHVLIETRGEGGFIVIAPSGGATHASRRPYELVNGGLDSIPALSIEERDALYDLARQFDEMPLPPPREPSGRAADGTRPGDQWASGTSWAAILEPAGFRLDHRSGDEEFWTRPGKARGVSATTNYQGSELLYVFSSSIGDLEPETTHTKFGAFAALYHGGDFAAAARALAAEGYGASPAAPRAAPPRASTASRLSSGASFVLDAPTEVPALLGDGDNVLHAMGEALMVVGPDGVGKTTFVQQYILARIRGTPAFLDLPVTPITGKVAYLAMDRPQQAARSFRRMVSEADRALLDAHLVVWSGPLPVDVVADPRSFSPFVHELDPNVEMLVVDSLKDVVIGLTEDKPAAAWNLARQDVLAAGIEVVELHHQRKEQQGKNAAKPKRLADVYGSRWLTAGTGSVVCLWGDAGDPVVEFLHLKQPATEVGPFRVLHDQATGSMSVFEGVDLLALLRAAPGLAVADAARVLFETNVPDRNEIEKARRRLRALVAKGLAQEGPSASTAAGGTAASKFYATTLRTPPETARSDQSRTSHAAPKREPVTEQSRSSHASLATIADRFKTTVTTTVTTVTRQTSHVFTPL